MTCENIIQQRLFSDKFIVDKQKQSNAKDFQDNLNRFNISSLKSSFSPVNNAFANKKLFAHMTRFRTSCLSRKIIPMLSQIHQYIIISKQPTLSLRIFKKWKFYRCVTFCNKEIALCV